MSETLTTFSSSETRVKYREPFVTEGLNAKSAVTLPPGLYRGFRLAATGSGSPRTLQIVADTTTSDHVAVYQTSTGYSLTLRKTSGSFTVNLSSAAFDNTSVVIAIYVTYALGAITTAALKVYTVTEYNAATEKPELLVLGSVDVGAAGVAIPAADIKYNRRTEAWETVAPQMVPYDALVRNSGFEWSQNGSIRHASAYWEREVSVGNSTWTTDSTIPNSGTRCVTFTYGGTATTGKLYQKLNAPVIAGQLVKYRFSKRGLLALTGGSAQFFVTYKNTSGATLSTETVGFALSGADGVYTTFENFFIVPASAGSIYEIGIRVTGITFGSSAAAFAVDDIQVWLERKSNLNQEAQHDLQGGVVATPLVLVDHDSFPGFSSYAGAVFEFDESAPAGEGRVLLSQLTGSSPPIIETGGRLHLGASRVGDELSALLPRIKAPYGVAAGIDYTLMWEIPPTSGTTPTMRIWTSPTGGMVVTTNAVWGTPTTNSWNKDVSGTQATKFELTSAGILNYQQRLAANNAAWLDSAWDTLPIRVDGTGDARVTAELLTLGASFLADATNSLKARITMSNSEVSLRTLLWEIGSGSGTRRSRIYVIGTTAGVAFEFVNNARYDGTNWNKDDTNTGCARVRINDGGVFIDTVSQPFTSPFTEGDFKETLGVFHFSSSFPKILSRDAPLRLLPSAAGSLNPTFDAVIESNTLHAKNIVKAWATIDLDGAGNIACLDGYNIDSVSMAFDAIVVNFTVSMANTSYAYFAWIGDTSGTRAVTFDNNALTFSATFLFYDVTATQVDLDVQNCKVYFMAIGQQGT